MLDRPNEDDEKIAREFADLTIKRYQGKDTLKLQIEIPKVTEKILENMEKMVNAAMKPPSRKGKNCSLCNLCEEVCPTKAMDATTGEANKDLCLRCLRCLISCPENALEMDDLSKQQDFIKKSNKLTEDVLKNRTSKVLL